MRTTVTLDPDVQVRLERVMQERRITFKSAVNETLRAGLDHERSQTMVEPYVVPVHAIGLHADIDWDRAAHLAADLEDEEILHKMAQGR
jgi:hypothetical protein